MTAPIRERLRAAQAEISDHLENGIMKFWLEHGIDHAHGGYLTGFDEGGARARTPTNTWSRRRA